mmetsp:Transcript_2210/g.5173  ORF Transcript_2210/g.5173 Transcript_2210/m.5173 type:complete len:115 (+) Transcript_2210:87-431(+)
MSEEQKSSSDGSPPEPKSLLGLESEGRPELITVEAEPEIVSPRVTRASLPPVALENGALECPACGGCFPDWERYYGHVIAPDNRVCAWVQIDLIDVVPKKKGDGEGGTPPSADS